MGLGARPRPDVRRPRNGRGWGRVQPRSAVQSSPARCGVRAGPAAPKAGWAMPGVWERDLELCPSPRPASVRRHLSASPRARGPSAPQFTSGTRRPLTAPRRPGSCWGTRSSCDLASRRAVLLQPPPVPKHLPVSLRHLPAPLRSDRLSTERPLAALSCPSRGAVSTLPFVVSLGLGGWLGDGSVKPNGEFAMKEGSSRYNPEQIKSGNPKSLFMPFCRTICWDSWSTFFPSFKVPKFPPLQGGRETRVLLQFCLGD